jgi:hypothetical protein
VETPTQMGPLDRANLGLLNVVYLDAIDACDSDECLLRMVTLLPKLM